MMVQPFNSDDERSAPAFWVLERQYRQMSLADLLLRFYAEFDWEDEYSALPISFLYNPEKEGKRIFNFEFDQAAVALYRKGFYAVIEKDMGSMMGPHATYLYYKSFQIENSAIWVATLQLDNTMFYDEVALQEALTIAIKLQQFFHSERSAREIIIL